MTSAAAATESGYLEAPTCQIAVAAAEVVAAAKGNPAPSLPDDVATWARNHGNPSAAIEALARQALARIERGSELKELWEESESRSEWDGAMADLRRRLG